MLIYNNRLPSIFPEKTINKSYLQLGTIPLHLCNHNSHLSFPSGQSIYHISGTAEHPLTFSERLPSVYGVNVPLVGASLVSSLSVSETTNKFPERLVFAIDLSCCLLTRGIFFLCGTTTYLCIPLTRQEHVPWYIWLQILLLLLTIRPFYPTNS